MFRMDVLQSGLVLALVLVQGFVDDSIVFNDLLEDCRPGTEAVVDSCHRMGMRSSLQSRQTWTQPRRPEDPDRIQSTSGVLGD